ncbi:hypothetical protein CFK37_14500 [Virgibacillus phasianinus]|uniref:Uncharacterized protein n=1 Tax=Virgibacillus phasianinus TaxID=2017483 RepID=A0A220U5F1_9BACI|nr:hypothetical protein [Virgibacillus phasianinus]ASK63275.1 hypothetical protein CFK37_14500 [Virgibacillus phasianinus]
MKKNLVKQLYWVIPVVIMMFGLVLLFYQNYAKVTEPPAPNWSRGLTIGQTNVDRLPPIKNTKNGGFIVTSFENQKLTATTVNSDFTVQDKKVYNIPVDKWTEVYQQDNHIIYSDYTNIYDKDSNRLVPDIEQFYPLNNTIFYVKENALYQLSPENKKSTKIMDIDLNKQDIALQESESGINILTSSLDTRDVTITLHQLHNQKINQLYQTKMPITPGKVVNDISFVLDKQKLGILLQEELEAPQGQQQYFNYFMETTLTAKSQQPLRELTFQDPAGNGQLNEISHVVLKYNNGKLNLLFQASGQTNTQYKNGSTTFNIYMTEISESGTNTVRRSNTPAISIKPQWVNNETIAWLDLNSDGNEINISSSDIAAISQATGFNQGDWIRSLGKTLGMLSSSIFAIAISAIWFIWPVAFIALMYFFRSRTIDRDPVWIFYTGIGIYAIAALAFKNSFFVQSIYTNAPDYLTFTGSSYFFMILFAVITYGIALLTKRENEWDSPVRVIYFVGVHILLLTTFFGPYVL